MPAAEMERLRNSKPPGQAPLLMVGPAGAGREALVTMLQSRFPGKVAMPPKLTDRKPSEMDLQQQITISSSMRACIHACMRAYMRGDAQHNAQLLIKLSAMNVCLFAGKTEKDTPELSFLKSDIFQKMVATGQLACAWQDDSGAGVGVTVEAMASLSMAGELHLCAHISNKAPCPRP